MLCNILAVASVNDLEFPNFLDRANTTKDMGSVDAQFETGG